MKTDVRHQGSELLGGKLKGYQESIMPCGGSSTRAAVLFTGALCPSSAPHFADGVLGEQIEGADREVELLAVREPADARPEADQVCPGDLQKAQLGGWGGDVATRADVHGAPDEALPGVEHPVPVQSEAVALAAALRQIGEVRADVLEKLLEDELRLLKERCLFRESERSELTSSVSGRMFRPTVCGMRKRDRQNCPRGWTTRLMGRRLMGWHIMS